MSSSSDRLITRRRDKLACVECRRRKLKCDRSTPCGACVRRGQADSCTYEASTDSSRLHPQAEARLERLEMLVTQLLSDRQESHMASTSPDGGVSDDNDNIDEQTNAQGELQPRGETQVDGHIIYNGPTNWMAIHEEIEGLRSLMAAPEILGIESPVPSSDGFGVDIIFGATANQNLAKILAVYLPSREDADAMVASYFRAPAVTAPFIHPAHFRRLYAEFWTTPSAVTPMFASIIFSICHISSSTLQSDSQRGSLHGQWAVAAAHCLAVGEYFRPQPLAVEALLLYAQAQCLTSQILPQSLLPVFGILVRQATVMGYHKDPETLGYGPFEQEMRRRTWSLCMQLDLLTSFHFGQPSVVQFPTWNCRPPQNLLNSDFDEESTELPQARPESEPTEIMFYIIKHRFMQIFEKILRHSLSTEVGREDLQQVATLDAELHTVMAGVPERLQPENVTDTIFDSAATVVTRLCVSFIYNKCICVLHRRYVAKYRAESVHACHEAATNLVRDFIGACQKLSLGGQLQSEKWFLSSLTWHDFLLGTMTVCLLLWSDATNESGPRLAHETPNVLSLLQAAQATLTEHGQQRASETQRVQEVVCKTIRRFSSDMAMVAPSPAQGADSVDMDFINLQQSPLAADDMSWADLENFMHLDAERKQVLPIESPG